MPASTPAPVLAIEREAAASTSRGIAYALLAWLLFACMDAGSKLFAEEYGRIVVHHPTVDTLGKMLRARTSDQATHDVGRDLMPAPPPPRALASWTLDQDGAPHCTGLDHITGVLVEISAESYKRPIDCREA
jgi:hypothetical protein